MTAALISIAGLLVTLIIAALGAVLGYGRSVQAQTTTANEVAELRRSVANLLARTQALETRNVVEQEFSGRVRP
jgi:hypothetical protein